MAAGNYLHLHWIGIFIMYLCEMVQYFSSSFGWRLLLTDVNRCRLKFQRMSMSLMHSHTPAKTLKYSCTAPSLQHNHLAVLSKTVLAPALEPLLDNKYMSQHTQSQGETEHRLRDISRHCVCCWCISGRTDNAIDNIRRQIIACEV